MPPESRPPGRAASTSLDPLLAAAVPPDGAARRAGPATPGYKGRIFGRSVLDVRFRAYGSESSDEGWADRTAGGLMSMDEAGERTDLRDLERRLYKVAKVSSLGYVGGDGRFHKPKSLPSQFGEVAAPAQDDLAFLRAQMGDVEIGRLRSGEDAIDLPVGIRGETLPSHVGVFATTGIGKSNL